jgi:hypothetical protein
MSDLKDDWLDYNGLAELAAEEQLSNPPAGAEARVHRRLMAAIGAPALGAPEALDTVDPTADVVELVRGVGEAVSTVTPSAGAVSSAAVGAGSSVTVGAASIASVGAGTTVTGGAAVGTSAFGAKGLALLLTIAGGGAAVTVAVHDAPTPETPAVAIASSSPESSTSRIETQQVPSASDQPAAASAGSLGADSPVVAPFERSAAASTPVEPARQAPPATPARRPRPTPRATTPVVRTSPPVAARDGALLVEQAILKAARRAIARHDVDGALINIRQHELSHPHGRLTQERELLRVQALARAGRVAEAEAAATRFRARFPESLMGKALEYALHPDAGVR